MSSRVRTFVERRTVATGPAPHLHIGYVMEAARVWVSNTGGSSITLLDADTGAPAGRLDVGPGPAHFAFDAGCRLGYVALRDADAVAVVDPRAERVMHLVRLPAGSRPTSVMPAFERHRVYTLNPGNGTVSAIDTESDRLVATIPAGSRPMWGQPWGSSYKPITRPVGKSYVTNAGSDDVTVFEDATDTVIGRVRVGREPLRNAIYRERAEIYVSNAADDTVSVIPIANDAVTAVIPVGHRPFRLLPVRAICGRDELWVLNAGSVTRPRGEVSVVGGDERRMTRSLPVVDRPANWVVNQQGLLFVVSATARELCVVDIAEGRVIGGARLSHDPQAGAISGLVFSRSGALFVLNDDSTVTVFGEQS